MFPEPLRSRAARLIASCRNTRIRIATAESCTGGLLSGLITTVPGSSEVFDRGFVIYSNAAKIECLGVSLTDLETFGAVSQEIALAMSAGALAHSSADLALSITGVAGPGGGTPQRPVGLVYFGLARKGRDPKAAEMRFGAIGRDAVRSAALATAIDLLFEAAR